MCLPYRCYGVDVNVPSDVTRVEILTPETVGLRGAEVVGLESL